VLTIAPTLGKQFGYLSEASTLFALMTYLGACAAAIRYHLQGTRGEIGLAIVGALFCVAVIALSTRPVLFTFLIGLGVFALLYVPLARRKYRLPDPTVRSGEFAKVRERFDDPGAR
jgi:hypothetical protein